jgi:hypothetical protein
LHLTQQTNKPPALLYLYTVCIYIYINYICDYIEKRKDIDLLTWGVTDVEGKEKIVYIKLLG